MKTRLTSPRATQGAWLIAGRWAAGAVLLAAAVSACTAGGSGSSVPSVFTPTPPVTGGPSGALGTRTPSPTGAGASTRTAPPTTTAPTNTASSRAPGTPAATVTRAPGTPAATVTRAPGSPTATVTRTRVEPTVTRTRVEPTRTVTRLPVAAPETGGGGTAGLQDGLLLGVGGLAVLSGLGTLAFRRRLRRSLDRRRPDRREDREPAGR